MNSVMPTVNFQARREDFARSSVHDLHTNNSKYPWNRRKQSNRRLETSHSLSDNPRRFAWIGVSRNSPFPPYAPVPDDLVPTNGRAATSVAEDSSVAVISADNNRDTLFCSAAGLRSAPAETRQYRPIASPSLHRCTRASAIYHLAIPSSAYNLLPIDAMD
jgi:hypothetical protein